LIRQLGSEWMVGEGCLETLWNLLMVRMFGWKSERKACFFFVFSVF
jgi:hypothetical protein